MSDFLHSNLAHIIALVVSVSIVYGATRDERPIVILEQIFRSALWMCLFLGLILVALLVLSAWL